MSFSRYEQGKPHISAIQAKFRLTAVQEMGCNFGALTGSVRSQKDKFRPYANGLLTCVHLKAFGQQHVKPTHAIGLRHDFLNFKSALSLQFVHLGLPRPFQALFTS